MSSSFYFNTKLGKNEIQEEEEKNCIKYQTVSYNLQTKCDIDSFYCGGKMLYLKILFVCQVLIFLCLHLPQDYIDFYIFSSSTYTN